MLVSRQLPAALDCYSRGFTGPAARSTRFIDLPLKTIWVSVTSTLDEINSAVMTLNAG